MKIIARMVGILAAALVAIALSLSGGYLLALPSNSDLPAGTYYIVGHGLGVLGLVLLGAITATAILAVLVRKRPTPFWLAIVGLVTITAAFVVFLRWIHPSNVLTGSWPALAADWQRQWAYGYTATAVLTFIALCALTGSVLSRRE